MINTIVFDMDGTILNSKQELPTNTLDAIKVAQKSGIEIILASGRGVSDMITVADTLGIKRIIAHNGSIVYDLDKKKVIFSESLNQEIAIDLFHYVKKHKLNSIFYSNQRPLLLGDHPEHPKLAKHFGTEEHAPTIDDIVNVQKAIVVTFEGIESSGPLLEFFKKRYPNSVEIRRSSPRTIDFNPKGISKASGLQFLAEELNIIPENTAVFGDAGNDITMMQWAKYSFGMGNAISEVKEVALEIIGDNNSDTISKKIYSLIEMNKGE